jgi:hypothetical protein
MKPAVPNNVTNIKKLIKVDQGLTPAEHHTSPSQRKTPFHHISQTGSYHSDTSPSTSEPHPNSSVDFSAYTKPYQMPERNPKAPTPLLVHPPYSIECPP